MTTEDVSGYLQYRLVIDVMMQKDENLTIKLLLKTAKACNNLVYCARIATLRDHHAKVDRHIQELLKSVTKLNPALMKRVLFKKSTVCKIQNARHNYMIKSNRRCVVAVLKSPRRLLSAHKLYHFKYDGTTPLELNTRRFMSHLSGTSP
jgi:hypothetical protein